MANATLETQYAQASKAIEEAIDRLDVTTIQICLQGYIDTMKQIFLSEENGIREMYGYIKSQSTQGGKTVNLYNLDEAEKAFKTYIDGFYTFITKLVDVRNEDQINLDKMKEKLDKIRTTNDGFMSSIFGGEKNPPANTNIDMAARNVEMMITLQPQCNVYMTQIQDAMRQVKERPSDSYDNIVKAGLLLFIQTVHTYCYQVMQYIVESYEKIKQALQTKGIKPVMLEEEKVFRIF